MTNVEKLHAVRSQIKLYRFGGLKLAMRAARYDGEEIQRAATHLYPSFTLSEIESLGWYAVDDVIGLALRYAASEDRAEQAGCYNLRLL